MFLRQQAEKLHQMIKDNESDKAIKFIKSHENSSEICSLECPRDGTSLHVTAKTGNVTVAKVILDYGVNINVKVTEGHVASGFTPLHNAVKSGYVKMTSFLIDHGADINMADQDGRTPLLTSCIYNYPDVAQLLISKGADVNLRDSEGQTPLMLSVLRSDFPFSEMLVLNGADIQAVDPAGQSALHYAAEWGKQDVVSLLLARGADVNLLDNEHQTALHLAEDDVIYHMLLEHGADAKQRDKRGKPARVDKLDKKLFENLNDVMSQHPCKANKRDPNQHVHEKLTRVFSPGPPIPEAELRNAKTNMLKELKGNYK